MAQITTEATKKMREVLMQRGHFEGESMRVLAKCYLLMTVIIIGNTLQDIYYLQADQFEEKVFRFKNINMLICGLAYPLLHKSTYRSMTSFRRLISYVEEHIRPPDLTFKPTLARSQLQQQMNADLNYVDRLTHTVVITIVATLSIAPLFTAIFKIYRQNSLGEPINVVQLSLPISFWYPEKYASLLVYFSLFIVQMFYVYLFAGYVYCDLTSSFMALKITIYDLKFLNLTVEEWDDNVGVVKENNGFDEGKMEWSRNKNEGSMEWNNKENIGGAKNWNNEENAGRTKNWNNEGDKGRSMNWNTRETTGGTVNWNNKSEAGYVEYNKENVGFYDSSSLLLRNNIVSVIKLHDMICRRSSSMNRDFEMIYTIYNNTICFQICVCLYTSAKENDIILKAENILHIIPLAGILFLYCFYSQEILNEGERFRMKLWNSSFVGKPKWYRSSMLIIMIRNSKELEMKPFGCYALNLKTFSVVMKAAYSYFNMLNSLKKRI